MIPVPILSRSFWSSKGVLFLIWENLTWSLVTGPVFSQHELSTDLKITQITWSLKFKLHRANLQTISSYPIRFSTDTANNNNFFFLLFLFGFFRFSLFFFSFFCFVCVCVFLNKKYITLNAFDHAGG